MWFKNNDKVPKIIDSLGTRYIVSRYSSFYTEQLSDLGQGICSGTEPVDPGGGGGGSTEWREYEEKKGSVHSAEGAGNESEL